MKNKIILGDDYHINAEPDNYVIIHYPDPAVIMELYLVDFDDDYDMEYKNPDGITEYYKHKIAFASQDPNNNIIHSMINYFLDYLKYEDDNIGDGTIKLNLN